MAFGTRLHGFGFSERMRAQSVSTSHDVGSGLQALDDFWLHESQVFRLKLLPCGVPSYVLQPPPEGRHVS